MRVFTNTGDLGVQLFFVVSSFTIFNSYAKQKEKNSININRIFFIKRFFRIAPNYYIAGLIYILYNILTNDFAFIFLYLITVVFTYNISKITYKFIEFKGIELGNKIIIINRKILF
jgi:peptidoglycan/LPS O-acetylase OafA/YrhL